MKLTKRHLIIGSFIIASLIFIGISYFVYQRIFAVSTLTGSTYYVNSVTGSDSNNGLSQNSPWKTLNKVNSRNFAAGDKILFANGQTFSGKIYINSSDSGTATSPITFSNYNPGSSTSRPTIGSGTDTGFYAPNVAAVEIKNLKFKGNGGSKNGLTFENSLSGGVKLDHITIDNIEVWGYGSNGIDIEGTNGTSGYKNVRITNSKIHDNSRNGISVYSPSRNVHQNFYIGYIEAYNHPGISGLSSNAGGSGVLLGSVDGGTIEHSISHDSGEKCTAVNCGAGLWAYDSNNITIQYNEVYKMRTGSDGDGDGLDIDQYTKNSVIQYNYTHDNDGPGILLINLPGTSTTRQNNIIRYNVSQNDARKLSAAGGIEVYGGTVGSEIYNNTVYMSPSNGSPRRAMAIFASGSQITKDLNIRNNIFQTTGGGTLVYLQSTSGVSGLNFQGNEYYSSGSNFKIEWAGSNYSSLDAWRSARNQEKLNGSNTGYNIDPKLENPGGGGTIGDTDKLNTLTAYKLKSDSGLIDKGLNLNSLFGINMGTRDFYDTTIPQNSNYEVGAYERPNSNPTCTNTLICDINRASNNYSALNLLTNSSYTETRPYYDRTAYKFTEIPSNIAISSAQYIQTLNNDKLATGDSFLTFTLKQEADVYLAFDQSMSSKPSWISGWGSVVNTVKATSANNSIEVYDVYKKRLTPGTVTIGGNSGTSNDSMYSVIIVPGSGSCTTLICSINRASNHYSALSLLTNGSYAETRPYYDRSAYKFTEIPSSIATTSAQYIQTVNGDKLISGDSFLTFDLTQEADIYLVYDQGINPPSWITSSWGSSIGTAKATTAVSFTNPTGIETYSIYKKHFTAGSITLGANYGNSVNSMYSVIVVPSSSN